MILIKDVPHALPFVLMGCCPEPPPPFAIVFGNWAKNYLDRVPKEFKRTESVRELVHAVNFVSVVSDKRAQEWALNEACFWWTFGDDLPKKLLFELRAFWLSILGGFKK